MANSLHDARTQGGAWALVPLKSSDQAKSRLASVLTPQQRSRLFFAMAEHVIKALRVCKEIRGVVVATASPQVAAFAANLGALTVMQSADLGMSFALAAALNTLQSVRPQSVLMLPGDLPLVSPSAVQQMLTANASGPGIVIAPDRQRIGTNALLVSPPQIIAPNFGGKSFERHLSAAAAAGVKAHVLELSELALDVDEPDDLQRLTEQYAMQTPHVHAALSLTDHDIELMG